MAETKPVQPTANRGAMYVYPMFVIQFQNQVIQRQIALRFDASPHPVGQSTEFPAPRITLWLRRKRIGLSFQNDHVIDEFDRNPEMRSSRAVRISLFDKRNNSFP